MARGKAARRTTLPDDTRRALPPPVTSGMAGSGCGRFLAELGACREKFTLAISNQPAAVAMGTDGWLSECVAYRADLRGSSHLA